MSQSRNGKDFKNWELLEAKIVASLDVKSKDSEFMVRFLNVLLSCYSSGLPLSDNLESSFLSSRHIEETISVLQSEIIRLDPQESQQLNNRYMQHMGNLRGLYMKYWYKLAGSLLKTIFA